MMGSEPDACGDLSGFAVVFGRFQMLKVPVASWISRLAAMSLVACTQEPAVSDCQSTARGKASDAKIA